MDRSFYTAAVGAGAHQQRLNVIANNMANVNTQGYKRKLTSFSECIYSNLNALAGEDTDYIAGSGLHVEKTDSDMKQSGFLETGRDYDFAIVGDGFFALQDPATGEITYTRDGSFRAALMPQTVGTLTAAGVALPEELTGVAEGEDLPEDFDAQRIFYLTSQDGKFVVNRENRPIVVGIAGTATEDAEEASVSGHLLDGSQLIGNIDLYHFVHTNGMESTDSTEFVPVAKNGAPAIEASSRATLQSGMLEMSNVDVADEMTKLIEAQRCYQYALKMVQTSDEVETTINSLRTQ